MTNRHWWIAGAGPPRPGPPWDEGDVSGLLHSSGGQRPTLGLTALVVLVALAASSAGCGQPRELAGTPGPGQDGGEPGTGGATEDGAADAPTPGEAVGNGSGGDP